MPPSDNEDDRLQSIMDELSARGVTSPNVEKTTEAAASQLGINEYTDKRNRELMKELKARGLKYEQGKLEAMEEVRPPGCCGSREVVLPSGRPPETRLVALVVDRGPAAILTERAPVVRLPATLR